MSEISVKVRLFGENLHYLNRLFLEKRLFKSIAYHYNATGRTFLWRTLYHSTLRD